MSSYQQLCQDVTNSVIAVLKAGDVGEWSAPWHHAADLWAPRNALTSNLYAGGNILRLAVSALSAGDDQSGDDDQSGGYDQSWWATYRQWKQLGAQVRRGEKSTTVVRWVSVATAKGEGEEISRHPVSNDNDSDRGCEGRLVPRVFGVFNVAQVDGWEPPTRSVPVRSEQLETAWTWVKGTGADISYNGVFPVYRKKIDRIEIPPLECYDDPGGQVVDVGHELIHWTSHPSRLDRKFTTPGVDPYAVEELVAELGAAFVMARLGIDTVPRADHAQYLNHWIQVLGADPTILFRLAAHAQQAVEHLDPPDLTTPTPATTADDLEVAA